MTPVKYLVDVQQNGLKQRKGEGVCGVRKGMRRVGVSLNGGEEPGEGRGGGGRGRDQGLQANLREELG